MTATTLLATSSTHADENTDSTPAKSTKSWTANDTSYEAETTNIHICAAENSTSYITETLPALTTKEKNTSTSTSTVAVNIITVLEKISAAKSDAWDYSKFLIDGSSSGTHEHTR